MMHSEPESGSGAEALLLLATKYDLRSAHAPSERFRPTVYDSFGPGWIPLIEDLVVRLIALGWNREIAQVKEKLGRLRFYVGETTPEMDALIRKAEERSLTVCNHCGAPGSLRTDPVATRCEAHARLGREAERA